MLFSCGHSKTVKFPVVEELRRLVAGTSSMYDKIIVGVYFVSAVRPLKKSEADKEILKSGGQTRARQRTVMLLAQSLTSFVPDTQEASSDRHRQPTIDFCYAHLP